MKRIQSSGDPGGAMVWFPHRDVALTPSMSAIVTTFTNDGFVIAADGRRTGAQDNRILSNTAQKIFPIHSPDGVFAYAMCGTIEIANHDRTEIVLNIAEEAANSADLLARRKTASLMGYAIRFSRPIQERLGSLHRSGKIHHYPAYERTVSGERGTTITRILIDGYRSGVPARVSIRFFHEDNRLQDPEIGVPDLMPGFHRIFGSPVIVNLLWKEKDSRFSKYRGPSIHAEDMTLQDAIRRSVAYIRACSDTEALNCDPYCYYIGGHIHVATITASEGFAWVPEFAPVADVPVNV